MRNSWTLSYQAIDILCEQRRLSPSPFPFEIPRYGRTQRQRERIRAAVFAELEARDLARDGQPDNDVDTALVLFACPEVALTVFGKLDHGRKLFARICASGTAAIRAVAQQDAVRFEFVRTTALVRGAVELIPPERPGEGRYVSFPLGSTPSFDGDDPPSIVSASRTRAAVQVYAAETMLARPKLRFGQFRVTVRGRDGRADHGPDLFWFDTAVGRYATQSSISRDGQSWAMFTPADSPRIGHFLATQLQQLLR
jgi:hypothetical protein